jgi:hypothetical protein
MTFRTVDTWHRARGGCKNLKTVAIIIAAMLLFVVGSLHAQGTAGAISGTVTDPTGAHLSDAAVTVTNEATGVSSKLTTNDSGFYSAEALNAGMYTVQISRPGFKEAITRGIQIDPGQRRANNVQLDVGSVNEQVTVAADVAQINTETSESAGTVTAAQINNLMLNGRNFQTLALAIPGVSSVLAGDSLSSVQSTYLIVNGMSSEYTTYSIDGVYNMNSGNLTGIDIVPILDGISEFRVLKDNYSAKYGSAGGAQVVVNTVSGAETFHGSAWDYLRNNVFDAANFFSTTSQRLQQNIYGFTLGGPVILPKVYNTDRSKKTFFFTAIQWHAINAGTVQTGAMFTQAMRTGNFSASPTLTSNLTLDSSSAALLASEGKTNCIAGPKTLNSACFDPVAVSLMNAYMPLPNNLPAGFNNYINQSTIYTREQDYQFRVDHSINSNNTLTARVMYQATPVKYPYSYSGAPSNLITYDTITSDFNDLVRLTSTITPRLVNVVGIANTENRGARNSLGPGATAGLLPAGTTITQSFPGADPYNRIPNITLSKGWSPMGVGAAPTTASDGEGIASDDVTWVKGNHVLQAGAVYMFGIKRQIEKTLPQGAFSFSGAHTGDPAADYLLGLDATYAQASTQRYGNFHYRQGEVYVQDDWKVGHGLTLNLGMRWQYFSNDTVSGDQVTAFSPGAYNPAQAPVVNLNGTLKVNALNVPVNSAGGQANLLNGLLFAGQDGVPSGFFIPTKKNFGPRVGFAYDLRGNGRSSIRGGYGIGYSRIPLEQVLNAFGLNPPYNKSSNIVNSLLSNGTAGTSAAPTTQTLASVPSTFVPSQVQSFSLTLEQQVGNNTIATIGYAGTLGRHLMAFQGGYDSNFPLPVAAPSTSNCLAHGQAPSSSYDFDPCINAGTVSSAFTRPYKGYSQMQDVYDEGISNYNSLQSALTYNGARSKLNISYTYSKSLGTIGETAVENASSQNTVAQNPRDYAAEYGPPAYDFTHNISATWVYDIPSFNHGGKVVGSVLDNWSFACLEVHQSGAATSLSLSTGTSGEAIRPNQIGPIRKIGKVSEWFDKTSFVAPPYGFFGNSSNGVVRGPAYTSFNTALYKTLPITERFKLQIRAEAFNVANHPNFAAISTGLGAANFGQITSAHNPRNLEFALKLTF